MPLIRLTVGAILNGLFSKLISLIVDAIYKNTPDILIRCVVDVRYEEGGEEKTLTKRFPFVWSARLYVKYIQHQWKAKKPRCVVETTLESACEIQMPLRQARAYKGHCIAF